MKQTERTFYTVFKWIAKKESRMNAFRPKKNNGYEQIHDEESLFFVEIHDVNGRKSLFEC